MLRAPRKIEYDDDIQEEKKQSKINRCCVPAKTYDTKLVVYCAPFYQRLQLMFFKLREPLQFVVCIKLRLIFHANWHVASATPLSVFMLTE